MPIARRLPSVRLPRFDLRLQVIVALVLSLLAAIAICRAAQAQSPAQPLPPIVVESPKKVAPKAVPKAKAAPKASPAPAAIVDPGRRRRRAAA